MLLMFLGLNGAGRLAPSGSRSSAWLWLVVIAVIVAIGIDVSASAQYVLMGLQMISLFVFTVVGARSRRYTDVTPPAITVPIRLVVALHLTHVLSWRPRHARASCWPIFLYWGWDTVPSRQRRERGLTHHAWRLGGAEHLILVVTYVLDHGRHARRTMAPSS